MKRSDLKLAPGPGGWVHVDWGSGKAWVRFEKDEQNKLTHITELHLLEPTAESLRRVPLGRIATAVRANGQVQFMLAIGLDKEVPVTMFSAFSGKGMDEPNRYRLKRTANRRLDDSFFEKVGRAYSDALIRGLNPRTTLAADTGFAVDTVAGWVLEARRRGHLPPAQPGRASGWRPESINSEESAT
jgi:hypothetical protein